MRDSSETFSLSGAFQRADGADITSAEMDAFMDQFIDLVEANGLGFGGGWKLDPKTDEEWREHELRQAAFDLRNSIAVLESDGRVTVPWKNDAEDQLQSLGLHGSSTPLPETTDD